MAVIIEYTFKIILAILVVAVFSMLIFTFRNEILGFIKGIFQNKKESNVILIKNAFIEDLPKYIIACYYKKINGDCYYIRINETDIETSCGDIREIVKEEDPNVKIAPCYFMIKPGDFIKIRSDGYIVYIEK